MTDIVERLRERAAFDRAVYAENADGSKVIRMMHERRLQLARDLDEAADEIERLYVRLEANFAWQIIDGVKTKIAVAPGSIPDGIDCRNETIKLQDTRIKELIERLRRPSPPQATGELEVAPRPAVALGKIGSASS